LRIPEAHPYPKICKFSSNRAPPPKKKTNRQKTLNSVKWNTEKKKIKKVGNIWKGKKSAPVGFKPVTVTQDTDTLSNRPLCRTWCWVVKFNTVTLHRENRDSEKENIQPVL